MTRERYHKESYHMTHFERPLIFIFWTKKLISVPIYDMAHFCPHISYGPYRQKCRKCPISRKCCRQKTFERWSDIGLLPVLHLQKHFLFFSRKSYIFAQFRLIHILGNFKISHFEKKWISLNVQNKFHSLCRKKLRIAFSDIVYDPLPQFWALPVTPWSI